MNKFFILFLFIPLYANAEYNEWNFKIAIKTVEGKELMGYGITINEINSDSLDNTIYLIKNLAQKEDTLFVYLNRIEYTNTSGMAVMHSTEYVLLSRIAISIRSIKKIKISEWEMGSTLSNIENELTLSDTSWLYRKPLKTVHIYANSCEYDIFIHVKNKKLDTIINKFKEVSKKHVNDEQGINVGEIREHQELIKKMKGFKVVVISFCTC